MKIISNIKYKNYQELLIYKKRIFKPKIYCLRKFNSDMFEYYSKTNGYRSIGVFEYTYWLPYFSIDIIDKSNE